MAFIQNKGLSLITKNVSCSHQIQSRENSSQGAEMPQAETPNTKYTDCVVSWRAFHGWASHFLPIMVPYRTLTKTESHAQNEREHRLIDMGKSSWQMIPALGPTLYNHPQVFGNIEIVAETSHESVTLQKHPIQPGVSFFQWWTLYVYMDHI